MDVGENRLSQQGQCPIRGNVAPLRIWRGTLVALARLHRATATGGLAALFLVAAMMTAGLAGVWPGAAVAQVPQRERLPGAIEPGRPPKAAQPQALEFQLELLIPDSRRDIATDEAQAITFELADLKVTGVTVVPIAEIEALFANLRGTEVSLSTLFEVAGKIEQIYRARDYILAQAFVPAQRVTDGIFRIDVIEGYVSDVQIEGDIAGVQELIERQLAGLSTERPLRSSTLERALLLVNDIPGVVATGVLRPSTSTIGAAQLVVTIGVDHYQSFSVVNNRQSKYAGPVGYTVGGSTQAFTPSAERNSLTAFFTNDWDEQRYIRFSHERSLGTNGMRLALGGDYATAEPGGGLKTDSQTLRSKAISVDASVTYPMIRSRAENLVLQAEAVYRDTKVKFSEDNGDANATFTQDHIRKLRLGLTYEKVDSWDGVTRFSADWHQGFKVLGYPRSGKGIQSRSDGEVDFSKLTFDLVRLQRIVDNLTLLLSVGGQTSPDPLLSSEEFTLGGTRFGRGYDPGELSGDEALAWSAELAWRNEGDFGIGALRDFEFYAFYDAGIVWNQNRGNQLGTTDVSGRDTLASAGGGTRLNMDYEVGSEVLGLGLLLEYAVPLTRTPAVRKGPGLRNREGRWYFGLTSRF